MVQSRVSVVVMSLMVWVSIPPIWVIRTLWVGHSMHGAKGAPIYFACGLEFLGAAKYRGEQGGGLQT